MQFRYLRIYTDNQGETHLSDRCSDLKPRDFAPPAAPLHVAELMEASECYLVGAETDWAGTRPHPTPKRQIFCVLQGNAVVTVSDGESRQVGPGELLLLEDTTGKGHCTRVVGDEPLLLLGISTPVTTDRRNKGEGR